MLFVTGKIKLRGGDEDGGGGVDGDDNVEGGD